MTPLFIAIGYIAGTFLADRIIERAERRRWLEGEAKREEVMRATNKRFGEFLLHTGPVLMRDPEARS